MCIYFHVYIQQKSTPKNIWSRNGAPNTCRLTYIFMCIYFHVHMQDKSTRLWDFPDIKKYMVIKSRANFWPQMDRMNAQHTYESTPFNWPEPTPGILSATICCCCSVLQRVAACSERAAHVQPHCFSLVGVHARCTRCYSVLQCVAVCCSVLQCVAAC